MNAQAYPGPWSDGPVNAAGVCAVSTTTDGGQGTGRMNHQRDFEGIAALVTGASSGNGRAAAEELGRHGAEVVVHGRDAARGSAVVDSIAAEGGKGPVRRRRPHRPCPAR